MLLRLIPHPSHPSVLFTLVYPTLPLSVPFPFLWSRQLLALAANGLDDPPNIHAFNPPTAIPALLREVIFDVPARSLSCIWSDGLCDQWPLLDDACLAVLDNIVRDVEDSFTDSDSPGSPLPSSSPAHRGAEVQLPVQPMAPIVKPAKHKKQRSLLMALVASLVPCSTSPCPPSPPASVRAASVPSSANCTASVLPSAKLSPRALRRRARSTLVDAFRRYVLPELRQRTSAPWDYRVWALQHALRRERLKKAKKLPGADGSDTLVAEGDEGDESEETEDADGTTTEDDDGSSVHTPSPTSTLHTHTQAQTQVLSRDESSATTSTCTTSTCTTGTTGAGTSRTRTFTRWLRELEAERRLDAEQERVIEADREVAARRRAWLNGCRVPFSPGERDAPQVHQGGYATVIRRSRLARSWTADDLYKEGSATQRWPLCEEDDLDGLDLGMDVDIDKEGSDDYSLCGVDERFDAMRLCDDDVGEHDTNDHNHKEIVLSSSALELESEFGLGVGLGMPRRTRREGALALVPLDVEPESEPPTVAAPLKRTMSSRSRSAPRVRTCSMSLPHDVCLALGAEGTGTPAETGPGPGADTETAAAARARSKEELIQSAGRCALLCEASGVSASLGVGEDEEAEREERPQKHKGLPMLGIPLPTRGRGRAGRRAVPFVIRGGDGVCADDGGVCGEDAALAGARDGVEAGRVEAELMLAIGAVR